jgi:hypothetical protein
MNSVVTNVAQSQLLNRFLIQQTHLNSNDDVLLDSPGTLNINPTPPSTIVGVLNASDIAIIGFKLYDRNGAIFTNDRSNILVGTTDTSLSTSIDPNLLLSASLFAANTAEVRPSQEQTDLDTFLENQIQQQIQQQTQIDTALGSTIQQQNQLNPVLENQDNTNSTITQTASTAAGTNNIDLLTQEAAANTTEQNTTNNSNTTTTTTTNTTAQTTPTPAQLTLTNAVQDAIRHNQDQHSLLLNAETSATAAAVLVSNATRTEIDTTSIVPTSSITPVTAISAPAPIEKIQANVDDNSDHSNQQQESAHTKTISHTKSTTNATVRLLGAVL